MSYVEHSVDQAELAGIEAAMEEHPCLPPFKPRTRLWRAWRRGWQAGRARRRMLRRERPDDRRWERVTPDLDGDAL